MKKFVAVMAIASAFTFSVPASAGGLFGDGGLFRGTVGNWLDENVEHPITTPMAREAAVNAGRAVGQYYGGPLGAMVGECAGNMVNQRFAGRSPNGCAPVMPVPQRGGWQDQGGGQAFGQHCQTPYGVAGPGAPLPLGSPCTVQIQPGVTHYGRIIP